MPPIPNRAANARPRQTWCCRAHTAGFTLIEVVLAVAIAAGMLLVVLTFYQQAAALRGRLIEETSGISAIRLLMERLTCELGAVRRSDLYQLGLSGGADNLQLLKLEFPRPGAWTNPATAAPFRLVSYSLQGAGGLVRSETPLWASSVIVTTNDAAPDIPVPPAVSDDATPRAGTNALMITTSRSGTSATSPARATGVSSGSKAGRGAGTARATRGTASGGAAGSGSFASSSNTSRPASAPRGTASLNATNAPDDTTEPVEPTDAIGTIGTTNQTNIVVVSAARGGLAIGQAQFVRFRYWDGSTWLEAWNTPDLPVGVEVSLGLEALPAETSPDEYPFELYRRVIYLPNHGPARSASDSDSTQEDM